jgi:hypothetical protein
MSNNLINQISNSNQSDRRQRAYQIHVSSICYYVLFCLYRINLAKVPKGPYSYHVPCASIENVWNPNNVNKNNKLKQTSRQNK